MLDPDEDLEEFPSSDEDVDPSELSGRFQLIRQSGAGVESPEFTSPIGSPRDGEIPISAKGRFLELKRRMQDDLEPHSHLSPSGASKSRNKSRATSSTDETDGGRKQGQELPTVWSREGSVSPADYLVGNVEELMESYRRDGGERGEFSSLSYRSENQTKMTQVCQQLREKDMRIIELESKVTELEGAAIDLQDALSERDKLLTSKVEALNCVSYQYHQDILDKEAQLSRTQERLIEIETRFDQSKNEKDRLNSEVQRLNTRLKDLEDTNNLLETARLELTSKNLDFEEKLSILKTDRNKLTEESSKMQLELEESREIKQSFEKVLSTKTEEYEIMISELKTSLEKSTEQMTKLKQQFQAKLKSLKEQLKEKSAESQLDLQEKISSLENKVAELEEEKGSLILIQEELAQLKGEKEVQEKEFIARLGEFESNFAERMDEYEKKIEEYEEKLEKSEEIIQDNQINFEASLLKQGEYENKIQELTTSLEKSTEQMTKLKKQFQVKLKSLKESQGQKSSPSPVESDSQAKISALENRIAELEDEKGNNLWIQEELSQIKSEKEAVEKTFEEKSNEYESRIEELKDLLERSSEQMNKLEIQQQFEAPVVQQSPVGAFDENVVQTRITSLENQVAELEEEKGSGMLLEEELARMKLEREVMENTFQEKTAEFESKIEELNAALTKSTEQMTKLKRQFQAKLKALKEEKKEDKTVDSQSQSNAELEGTITALQNRVAELEEEKGNLLLQMVDFDEQQASRQEVEAGEFSHSQEETMTLEINLAEKEEELRMVQDQLNELTAALSQKNGEVEQLMKNCSEMQQSLQQKVDELSGSVNSKEEEVRRVIQEYEEDNRRANERISQLEEELLSSNEQLFDKDVEVQNFMDKLSTTEKQLEESAGLILQYQGLLEGSRGQDQGELALLQQELEAIKQKALGAEQAYESMKSGYVEEMGLRLQTIKQLQDELNKLTAEQVIKENELEESKKRTTELQQYVETLEIQCRNAETGFKNQIEQFNTKLSAGEGELHELKSKLSDSEILIEQLKAVNENYRTEVEDALVAARDSTDIEQQLKEKDSAVQTLSLKLADLETEKSLFSSQLTEVMTENSGLHQRLSEMNQGSQLLQAELGSFKEQYVSSESSYNELFNEFSQKAGEIEQLRSLIEELRTDLNTQNVIVNNSNMAIAALENEKTQLSLHVERSQAEATAALKRLTELTNDYSELRESFEARDAEARRLREDSNCLQSEYSDQSNELKLKISTLMDQLNDCEGEISVITQRLKESDDTVGDVKSKLKQTTQELEEKIKSLEDRSKALEQTENSLFEKTEELVRLEERIKEIEEKHKIVLEENLGKYSEDLDAAYDQLSSTTNENVTLQEKLRQKEEHLQELRESLASASKGNNQVSQESNELTERIGHLEFQLNLSQQQLEEVKTNEATSTGKIAGLMKELEQNRDLIKELNVELEESRSLSRSNFGARGADVQNAQAGPAFLDWDAASEINFGKNEVPFLTDFEQELQNSLANPPVQQSSARTLQGSILTSTASSSVQTETVDVVPDVNDQARDKREQELEHQISEYQQQVQSLQVQLASFNIAEWAAAVEARDRHIYDLQLQITELNNLLEQTKQEQQQLQNPFANPPVQQSSASTLQESAPAATASSGVQTEAEKNDEAKAKREQELERQISEYQQQIQSLQVQLASFNTAEWAAAVETRDRRMFDLELQITELNSLLEQNKLEQQQQQVVSAPTTTADNTASAASVAELTTALEARDQRIYELEVQITDLQITIDDANMQLSELGELKASVAVISFQLSEAEDLNKQLKKELDIERNEKSKKIQQFLDMEAISGMPKPVKTPPKPKPTPAGPPQPVEEPMITKKVAFAGGDALEGGVPGDIVQLEEEVLQQEQQSIQVEKEQYQKEIKDLKVKNGKMIQRFKQLKDKYDGLLKENEMLKTKKEFSLDSAFEDEFLNQVKQKETLLEEKAKLISELQTENVRLTEKLDLLERGTDRLTEMKEEQDRTVQDLVAHRRNLETEVSALKWKVEELENLSLNNASTLVIGSDSYTQQNQEHTFNDPNNSYFDVSAADQIAGENSSLKQQNLALSQELQFIRGEIESYKKQYDEINERNQQLEDDMEKLQEFQIEQNQVIEKSRDQQQQQLHGSFPSPPSQGGVTGFQSQQQHSTTQMNIPLPLNQSNQHSLDSAIVSSMSSADQVEGSQPQSVVAQPIHMNVPFDDNRLDTLVKDLQAEDQERKILERKIELLQSKISEIEISEIKCFEESLMLKSWTRQLELDNIKIQRELERIYASLQDGDTGNVKVKVLQDEVLRLVDALQDRDKRCEELTLEITRLLEERDTLQLKLSNVLRHNVSLHEEANKGKDPPTIGGPSYDQEALQMKLAELEQMTFTMGIDLRREREARRLVQEQLFFSSSSRVYPSPGGNSYSYGSGARQSSPVRRSQTPTPTQTGSPTHSVPPMGTQSQPLPVGRSMTPTTPQPMPPQYFQPSPVPYFQPSPSPPLPFEPSSGQLQHESSPNPSASIPAPTGANLYL